MPVKAEPREQAAYPGAQESAVALEDSYQEEQYEEYDQYEEGYGGVDPNTGLPLADGNKGELLSIINTVYAASIFFEFSPCPIQSLCPLDIDGQIRKMMLNLGGGQWQCSQCSLVTKSTNLYNHIEAKHTMGAGHTCGVCGQFCATKHALKNHTHRVHAKQNLLVPLGM
jgi:hypothetical protein